MTEISQLISLLHPIDIKVLREIHVPGSQKDISWGGAMGLAVESLRGLKLIAGFYELQVTDLGLEILKELDRC